MNALDEENILTEDEPVSLEVILLIEKTFKIVYNIFW